MNWPEEQFDFSEILNIIVIIHIKGPFIAKEKETHGGNIEHKPVKLNIYIVNRQYVFNVKALGLAHSSKMNKILTTLVEIKVGLVSTTFPFVGRLVAHKLGIDTLAIVARKLVVIAGLVNCQIIRNSNKNFIWIEINRNTAVTMHHRIWWSDFHVIIQLIYWQLQVMAVHVGGHEVVYYTYHSLFHQTHPDSPGSNHTSWLPVYRAHFYSVCSHGDKSFYLREQNK